LTISQQNVQLKNTNFLFFNLLKSLYLVVICNLASLQDRDTKVKLMFKIPKKIIEDLKPSGKSEPDQDPKKIIPDPQH
jgi:hypothetical protein